MIVIQFGIHKSASTYCAQLIRRAIQLGGYELVPSRDVVSCGKTMMREAANLTAKPRTALVLKTHEPPTPVTERFVKRGKAKVVVTYRDPREVVLSAIDAGKIEREQNLRNRIAKIFTIDDAIEVLVQDVRSFTAWQEIGGCSIFYNDLISEPEAQLNRILHHLKLSVSGEEVLEPFRNRDAIGRLNKGILHRYRDEMTEADQRRILLSVEGYVRTFLPPDTWTDLLPKQMELPQPAAIH